MPGTVTPEAGLVKLALSPHTESTGTTTAGIGTLGHGMWPDTEAGSGTATTGTDTPTARNTGMAIMPTERMRKWA